MKNKIFIAIDTTSVSKVRKIIKKTQTSKLKIGYKFGLEFLNSKNGRKFVSKLKNQITFGDFKFSDIPNTCVSAVKAIKDLNINDKKVNLDGGALALGHPLGATGARITGKAADLLKRENKKYALATQCIGLGMGIATIIESID